MKDMNTNLQIEFSKLEFGLLQEDNLPKLAVSLLEAGLDSPSLRILAGLTKSETAEIKDYWQRIAGELNIDYPSRQQAAWVLISHFIEIIINDQIDPHEGIHTIIWKIYHKMDWEKQNKEYAGDSIGIQELYGLCDTFDDLEEASARWDETKTNEQLLNELRQQIIEAAMKYKNDYLTQRLTALDAAQPRP